MKFSEANRKQVDTIYDLVFIQEFLTNRDKAVEEVLNFNKDLMFEEKMLKELDPHTLDSNLHDLETYKA